MTVTPPKCPLPEGAWDTHAHVFGPFDRFPLAAGARYQPPEGTARQYMQMLDTVGFARGVLVHPSAYGNDHSATLDTVQSSGGRVLAVGVPPADCPDAVLEALVASGVRGVRFTEAQPNLSTTPQVGTLHFADFPAIAPRLRAFGLHAQVWARCDHIAAFGPQLLASGVPVVIDHMGYYSADAGVAHPSFQALLDLLRSGQVWVKMTAIRNAAAPDYEAARPFHDAILRTAPDRMLWGSDWPFIGLDKAPPDPGRLIDLFDAWTGDDTIRRKVFVDNPSALYGA